MRRTFLIAACFFAVSAHAEDSEQSRFVYQFINDMSNQERIRAGGENVGPSTQERFSTCIRQGTQYQLELGSEALRMRMFKLPGNSKGNNDLIAETYDNKAKLWGRLTDVCTALISGPKPGVDYAPYAAEMPKLVAKIEYVDKTLFQGSALVAATLVSDKPDAKGHMNHLVITRKERADIVKTINSSFKNTQRNEQSYVVSAALVVRDILTKQGFKMADEP